MFDPFEYLVLRDKDGLLKTDFKTPLGKVSLSHSLPLARAERRPEDARSAGVGAADEVDTVERCSGHDGTWGVKSEFYADVDEDRPAGVPPDGGGEPDYVSSDCPIAGRHIQQGIEQAQAGAARAEAHPLTLIRIAYGLPGTIEDTTMTRTDASACRASPATA